MRVLPACPSPASSPSCATPSRREPETPHRSGPTIAPPSAISDAQGRGQARKIGAAIRAAGAAVDRVPTSQWCRCRDTARFLDLGPVEDLPALNSFFRNRDRAGPQTAELRQFLLGLQPGKTVVLVTHQVNITALTGRIPASGEVFLLEIGRDGTISVVDEILIGP